MAHISAREIVVEFPIYNLSHRSLKNAVLHATTGGRLARDTGNRVVVRALDHASFDIRDGDRVGLHGHNGAGKTTLLRVLSGIYEPVSGELATQGRIATLLDLGLGIDPESSGYENIMLRGILAGLRPLEIRNKMEEIAEFTELAEYLDMPVRTYSSGMQLRLAFAVSTSVHADILLMDEWLSVGDAAFAAKAQERLHSLVNRSSILVLASHSLELLTTVCTRVFHMEHGVIVEKSVEELRTQLTEKEAAKAETDQAAARARR
jgi:lipopolysaccharide transport system ATP-binding protein